MRIAFVTAEHVVTHPSSGGLATFVDKITQMIGERGDEVHIFVPSEPACVQKFGHVWVHRIDTTINFFEVLRRMAGIGGFLKSSDHYYILSELSVSASIGKAVKKFERMYGKFDWVHASDYMFRGLFVPIDSRPIIVRCSWARDLVERIDGIGHYRRNRWSAFLERLSIRRADAAYAPSRVVSDHYKNIHDISVKLIRPPLPVSSYFLDKKKIDNNVRLESLLPDKYIIHFGQMSARKGTDYVISAASALQEEGVSFIFAGVDWGIISNFGKLPKNILYLGMLERSDMLYVLSKAIGSILPSRIDNLPNTAIESLGFGIPVVTWKNNGVDELISTGLNGIVVENRSVNDLVLAIRSVWNGDLRLWDKGLFNSPLAKEMNPEMAIQELFSFVKSVMHKNKIK